MAGSLLVWFSISEISRRVYAALAVPCCNPAVAVEKLDQGKMLRKNAPGCVANDDLNFLDICYPQIWVPIARNWTFSTATPDFTHCRGIVWRHASGEHYR